MYPALPDVYDIPIVGNIKMGITYQKELGVGNYYFYTFDNCESEHELVYVIDKVQARATAAAAIVAVATACTLGEDIVTWGAGIMDDIATIVGALEVASLVLAY